MPLSDDLRSRLVKPSFPRASTYDAAWMLDSWMGPNPLWLAEWLGEVVPFERGMRLLDLGCGKAASSIFLAREFGATVWAADLWVKPAENFQRIEAAGLADRVLPIHAEAHSLPFAEGFFDAIVSLDAYHYFGTDDLYLGYLARFLRAEGRLGIAVPGLVEEFGDQPPPWLQPYWEPDFHSFHSPAWWRRHWTRSGAVDVEVADNRRTAGVCGPSGTRSVARSGQAWKMERQQSVKPTCCGQTPGGRSASAGWWPAAAHRHRKDSDWMPATQ